MTTGRAVGPHNRVRFKRAAELNTVSFIIPVYNDPIGLRATLNSLQELEYGEYRAETLVANDGGQPVVRHICQDYKVKMVNVEPRCGAYFARNRALEYARGEYLLFLDADVTIPPEWLLIAMKELKQEVYLAAEISIDRRKVLSATHLYEIYNAFPIREYVEKKHFGVTAGLLVRRELIKQLGGFDQRVFSGGDSEFGRRVHEHGINQVYLPEPAIIHPPRSFEQFVKKTKRTKQGYKQLTMLHPGRFYNIPRRKMYLDLLTAVLPPRPGRVREYFSDNRRISPVRLYFFLWLKKWVDRFYELKYARNPGQVQLDFSKVRVAFKDFSTPGDRS